MERFAGARNGPEAPASLARLRVVSIEEPTNAVLATGYTSDDHVLHDQWSDSNAVPGFVIGNLDVPEHGSCFRIQREQVSIDCAKKNAIAKYSNAPVHLTAADIHFCRCRTVVPPELAAGMSVNGDNIAGRLGEVHHTIDHQGCCFHRVRRP